MLAAGFEGTRLACIVDSALTHTVRALAGRGEGLPYYKQRSLACYQLQLLIPDTYIHAHPWPPDAQISHTIALTCSFASS